MLRKLRVVERDRRRAEHDDELAVTPVDARFEHVHRRAADEAGDEHVDRVVVQLLRRRHLLQLGLPHHGDAIPHRHRLDLVVRDVDGRDGEVALDLLDVRAHLHPQLRVQVRQRLVHEEDGRLPDDGAAHRHALSLAAGKCARLAVEIRLQIEDASRLGDSSIDLRLRQLLDLERERDVAANGQVRVERVVLKDHRDVAVLGRQIVDSSIADAHEPSADLLQPGDHPERGRLAASRGSDQDDELPVGDFEIEPIDGERSVTVDLGDTVKDDASH